MLVWMPVAREEPFQPQYVAVVRAPDNDRPAAARLEQADAAQDERAHDAFAQLSLCDQEIAEFVRRDDERFDAVECDHVHQGGAARELGEFGRELAGAVGDDLLDAVRTRRAG